MFKVLLADHEQYVQNTLEKDLPWTDYGLELAYTASSGNEAFEILNKFKPDIAIFSVFLPEYSGLALCRFIYANGLNTKVILLSNYVDFSYMQKALQYDVTGYLLKPVEISDLKELLLKAVRQLTKFPAPLPGDALLAAVRRNESAQVSDFLRSNGFKKDFCYMASSAGELPLPLSDTLSMHVDCGLYVYFSAKPFDRLTLEKELSESDKKENRIDGIGLPPEPVIFCEGFSNIFYRCIAMAYHYFTEPDVRIWGKYEDSDVMLYISRIQNAASLFDRDTVCRLLLQIPQLGYFKYFSVYTARQLYDTIICNSGLMPYSNENFIYDYRQMIIRYGTLKNMIQEMVVMIRSVKDSGCGETEQADPVFSRIIGYIDTYYNESISLKDLALAANLSPNYISKIFKKQTGSTFSQYLIGLRIEHAKNLLSGTAESVGKISEKVGFNDYFHFARTFKKYTGWTPSQYRNISKSQIIR